MEPFKIDVPVLLIFFCRPDCLAKVFEQVKLARPSKLFLYQDGPRLHKPDDGAKIQKCRDLVEDIDWECEIHRFYQEKNVGCDPSEYIAIKWMFEHVDRGVILEDDDVPSQSFFPFCGELLERYKDDPRINKILGMNHMGIYSPTESDYFFTNVCSIWGWATWKRCTDVWQEHLDFLDDEGSIKQIGETYSNERIFRAFLRTCKWHKESGRAYYESITEAAQRLNGQFNIAPRVNLITNVGQGADSTHNPATNLKMVPRAIRRVFELERYEFAFPLTHPKQVELDYAFETVVHKIVYPGRIRKLFRLFEIWFLKLFCTGAEGRRLAWKSFKRRVLRRV